VIVGLASYSLYLWHWPVFVWLTPARAGLSGWALTALRFGVAGALAAASYLLIEQPVRRRVYRVRAVAVGGIASAGALVAALLFVGQPRPGPGVTVAALAPTGTAAATSLPVTSAPSHTARATSPSIAPPTTPSTTLAQAVSTLVRTHPSVPPALRRPTAENPLRVVLVGDSYMFDAAPGIEAALESTGMARVEDHSTLGFAITRDGSDGQLRAVIEERPDLVITMWARFDIVWMAENDAAAYAGRLDAATRLLVGSGAHVVVVVGLAPSVEGLLDPHPVPREINGLFARLPDAFPGQVTYLDPDPVVAPSGEATRSIAVPGGELRVRKPDLSHFCPDGAARFGQRSSSCWPSVRRSHRRRRPGTRVRGGRTRGTTIHRGPAADRAPGEQRGHACAGEHEQTRLGQRPEALVAVADRRGQGDDAERHEQEPLRLATRPERDDTGDGEHGESDVARPSRPQPAVWPALEARSAAGRGRPTAERAQQARGGDSWDARRVLAHVLDAQPAHSRRDLRLVHRCSGQRGDCAVEAPQSDVSAAVDAVAIGPGEQCGAVVRDRHERLQPHGIAHRPQPMTSTTGVSANASGAIGRPEGRREAIITTGTTSAAARTIPSARVMAARATRLPSVTSSGRVGGWSDRSRIIAVASSVAATSGTYNASARSAPSSVTSCGDPAARTAAAMPARGPAITLASNPTSTTVQAPRAAPTRRCAVGPSRPARSASASTSGHNGGNSAVGISRPSTMWSSGRT
jgi:hypothetical protein